MDMGSIISPDEDNLNISGNMKRMSTNMLSSSHASLISFYLKIYFASMFMQSRLHAKLTEQNNKVTVIVWGFDS